MRKSKIAIVSEGNRESEMFAFEPSDRLFGETIAIDADVREEALLTD